MYMNEVQVFGYEVAVSFSHSCHGCWVGSLFFGDFPGSGGHLTVRVHSTVALGPLVLWLASPFTVMGHIMQIIIWIFPFFMDC